MKAQVLVSRSLVITVLLGVFLGRHAVAQAPPPPVDRQKLDGGVQVLSPNTIGDSMVGYVYPDHVETGTPFDICFHVTVSSPDLEYMDRFEVVLPGAWTVHGVYHVPDNGCGHGTTEGVEVGNVVYWQDATYPPQTECGAWSNGSYEFCASVTVSDCIGEPWALPWTIIGDGYGSPPHVTPGDVGPVACTGPGLHISPITQYDIGCHSTQTYTLNLANNTGSDDTFGLSYMVSTDNATLTGPDQIYLGSGVDQDFVVELTPRPCLPRGTQISASMFATGGGDVSSAQIFKLIGQACDFSGCPFVYLPLILR
jgi:hypothetical protein